MTLTDEQRLQVENQLRKHDREQGMQTITLDNDTQLTIEIADGVFGSDFMTVAVFLAQYLHANKDLYLNKRVVDLGCASGIQGIITSLRGAKSVLMTDINAKAVANASRNISSLALSGVNAIESDLFTNFPAGEHYDVIIFNHPFFPEEAETFGNEVTDDVMLRRSMLGGTELLEKFFTQVGTYLNNDGVIVMPYFHLAGPENNPGLQAPKYGFTISEQIDEVLSEGAQKGNSSIYIIRKVNHA